MEVPSRIRGFVVAAAVSWVGNIYGVALLGRVFGRMKPEEHRLLTAVDLVVRWVDIPLFERFLDLSYDEVFALTGISREEFDRTGIEGGGGRLLREVFLFVFSLVDVKQILYRAFSLRSRVYSSGRWSIIQNEKGIFSANIEVPDDMNGIIIKELRYGYPFMLKLANAENLKITIDNESAGKFFFKMEYD